MQPAGHIKPLHGAASISDRHQNTTSQRDSPPLLCVNPDVTVSDRLLGTSHDVAYFRSSPSRLLAELPPSAPPSASCLLKPPARPPARGRPSEAKSHQGRAPSSGRLAAVPRLLRRQKDFVGFVLNEVLSKHLLNNKQPYGCHCQTCLPHWRSDRVQRASQSRKSH